MLNNINDKIKKFILEINEKKISYIVGGYLRDSYLGYENFDVDIASSMSLDEMLSFFSSFEPKVISEKLQIISFKNDGIKYEIARMRQDLNYRSNRKDFDFVFTDNIQKDLERRDYSINALAYDGTKFYHLKNTLNDLNKRNLNIIGNADKRYLEDPLRILRGLRFYAEKSLTAIEEATFFSMQKNKDLIWTLTKEMIQNEFIKIFKAENYLATLEKCNEINFFNGLFFRVNEYQKDYKLRLHDIFDKKNIEIAKKLNFSHKFISNI